MIVISTSEALRTTPPFHVSDHYDGCGFRLLVFVPHSLSLDCFSPSCCLCFWNIFSRSRGVCPPPRKETLARWCRRQSLFERNGNVPVIDPCGSSCPVVGTCWNVFFECVVRQSDQTEGRIRLAHLEEDVLKRSGAALLTVERSAEQRSPDSPQVRSTGE